MLQTAPAPAPALVAELDRQLQVLLAHGVPALAGLSERALRDAVDALRVLLPPVDDGLPFALVVPGTPRHEVAPRLALRGKQGFTSMEAEDLARFAPTVDVPDAPVYLALGVATGVEHLNRTPDQALPDIEAAGRSPLTLDEGLAIALQHPALLKESCCFSMLGSRCGDRRVTAVWLSKGRPRLGWCYAGAPHTWLGSGWLTRRLAA